MIFDRHIILPKKSYQDSIVIVASILGTHIMLHRDPMTRFGWLFQQDMAGVQQSRQNWMQHVWSVCVNRCSDRRNNWLFYSQGLPVWTSYWSKDCSVWTCPSKLGWTHSSTSCLRLFGLPFVGLFSTWKFWLPQWAGECREKYIKRKSSHWDLSLLVPVRHFLDWFWCLDWQPTIPYWWSISDIVVQHSTQYIVAHSGPSRKFIVIQRVLEFWKRLCICIDPDVCMDPDDCRFRSWKECWSSWLWILERFWIQGFAWMIIIIWRVFAEFDSFAPGSLAHDRASAAMKFPSSSKENILDPRLCGQTPSADQKAKAIDCVSTFGEDAQLATCTWTFATRNPTKDCLLFWQTARSKEFFCCPKSFLWQLPSSRRFTLGYKTTIIQKDLFWETKDFTKKVKKCKSPFRCHQKSMLNTGCSATLAELG